MKLRMVTGIWVCAKDNLSNVCMQYSVIICIMNLNSGEVLLQHGRYGEYGPLYEGTIVRQDGKVKTAVAVKTLKLCSRFSESQSFNELQIM